MNVTSIRIKLTDENSRNKHRVLAYCSVVFDDVFVVHDIKILRGADSSPHVVMPSVEKTDRCDSCGSKNSLRSLVCRGCRKSLDPFIPEDGKRLWYDVAHPVNLAFRRILHEEILKVYYREESYRSDHRQYVYQLYVYDCGRRDLPAYKEEAS